jgi:hypothetical protein
MKSFAVNTKPNMDESSMDSSMDGMWAAKVDQLELEQVTEKNAAIKFPCSDAASFTPQCSYPRPGAEVDP